MADGGRRRDRGQSGLPTRTEGTNIDSSMNEPNPLDDDRARRPVLPRLCAAVAVAIGLTVLIGWALDVEALKSLIPGLITMKPNAALGFLLAGGAALGDPGRSAAEPAGVRAGGLGRDGRGPDALRVLSRGSTCGSTSSWPASRPDRWGRSTRGGCTRRRPSTSSCSGPR